MPTRTNLCPNPTCGSNATGWNGGSRATGLTGLPRTTGYLGGTSEVDPPLGSTSSNTTYTYSAYFKATATGVIQYGIDWYYFSSYQSSSTSYSQNVVAGQVYQLAVTATSPSYFVTQARFWSSGCNGQVTCLLYEVGSVLSSYFDGDTPGATWAGTAENSTSSIPANYPQTITVTGIPTGTSFGNTTVVNEAPKVISPIGIASAAVFGVPTVSPGPVTVDLTDSGIASQETWGVPKELDGFLIAPTGIPSGNAWGVPTVTPGPVTVFATGIPSREAFGFLIAKRITVAIPTQIASKTDVSVRYDMVCVSRVMQQQSAPQFVEVDPLEWSGLSYSESISSPTTLTAGVPIANITDPVIQILKDMSHRACELWLYRNGKLIFSGPWLNWQIQNDTLTLNAKDASAYMDWWYVMSDQTFNNVDQFTIAKKLIDQWQALDYGNFGLNTSGIGLSGVTRNATYLKIELDQVSKMLSELGLRQNGFDYSVDPVTRAVNLYYPSRGVDRSSGVDAIIFDARNVVNTNVLCSAGPQDIASEGIASGTASGSTNGPVYSTKSNLDLRAQFGRTGFASTFNGVSEQATIDAYAQALTDARTTALLVPGPDVRVTPDADLSMYDVGDTVEYQLHQSLDISGAYRIKSRRVVVSAQGKETVTPTFV